jgi:hypothetical protein
MNRSHLVSLAFLLLACGKPPAPPEPPPEPPPQEEVAPEPPKEEPKPEPPKPPEALKKPASALQIDGKSISAIPCADVAALAKKEGWLKADPVCGGGTAGVYESGNIDLEKGKMKGTLTMVRPATKPTVLAGAQTPAPSELAGLKKDDKASYVVFDEAADVILYVTFQEGGQTADGKKLLDKLVKKSK